MAFWNEEIETMPAEELKRMQLELLKAKVSEMYEKSPFFRRRMDEAGVRPEEIDSFESFRRVPFMRKSDLRDNYPDGLFAVPYEDIVRIHVSSGTTGRPTVVGYTKADMDNWTESLARGMTSFGMTSSDVFQNFHGYGLFTGGLGVHYGAEKVGATVLPTSTGNTERQIQLMRDLPVTAWAGTPSYMFHIADVCDRMGVDIRRDTKVRLALAGGEPWSESMRRKLQDRTGIRVHNCYGASEMYGPMLLECSEQYGLHAWADLVYVEIIGEDGEPCAEGEKGELVVTMLKKEAFPLIRYRMGDVTSITWERCACGRTHPRLSRIAGRTDDMLVVRGVNVFPSQIESVIGEMPFLAPFYHITLENSNFMDAMTVEVELTDESLTEDMQELAEMSRRVEARLKSVLNIKADVRLVLPGTLERFEGKAKHVTDNRSYDRSVLRALPSVAGLLGAVEPGLTDVALALEHARLVADAAEDHPLRLAEVPGDALAGLGEAEVHVAPVVPLLYQAGVEQHVDLLPRVRAARDHVVQLGPVHGAAHVEGRQDADGLAVADYRGYPEDVHGPPSAPRDFKPSGGLAGLVN